MKKEFLDYLYELRGKIQGDIDRLVEISKQPRDESVDPDYDAELRTRRSQIFSTNETIEVYLKLHKLWHLNKKQRN